MISVHSYDVQNAEEAVVPAKEKFLPLEFIRFVMALGVCYAHLVPSCASYFNNLNFQTQLLKSVHGMLAVPAFFIISGFFLNCDKDFIDFIVKKIIRLWPVLAFSILIHLKSGYDLLGLLFINNGLGIINRSNTNPAIWYVCVLFWGMICFYLFLKNTESKKQNLPLILISYFSLFLVCQGGNSYDNVIASFFTLGVAYGIFGISSGILLRKIWPYIRIFFKNIKLNFYILSVLEFLITASFVYITFFYKGFLHPTVYIINFIFFFIIIHQNGLISNIFSKLNILGRYSYSLYLMQFPCFYYMRKFLWPALNNTGGGEYIIITSLIIMIVCSILCFHTVEHPISRFLERKWKNIESCCGKD